MGLTDLQIAIQMGVDLARDEGLPYGLAAYKVEQMTGVDRSDVARGMADRARVKREAQQKKNRSRWHPSRWTGRSWGDNGEDVDK